MLAKLRTYLESINPAGLVALGVAILTIGLNGFADTLTEIQSRAEETLASLNAVAAGQVNARPIDPAESAE